MLFRGKTIIMAVLVRYDEIGIKGKNRPKFEKILVNNIESCLRANNVGYKKIKRAYGRIIIHTNDECVCLKRVFGIVSFSHAINTGSTIEETAVFAKKLVESLSENDSFKISCQRLDKKFVLKSNEVCVKLGSILGQATKAKVKMEKPSVEVSLEIIDGIIYVLTDRIEGCAGMPVGCQGVAVALIDDPASVVAALMVMKRGCTIIPAMLNDVDISLLKSFSCGKELITEKISSVNELGSVAIKHNAQAVVLNDNYDGIRDLSGVLVLRPLCCLDNQEVENENKKYAGLAG